MSQRNLEKVGAVVAIVLVMVLFKIGGQLFSPSSAPSSARVSGPSGTYRGGLMVFSFDGNGTVDWPALGTVFRGTVSVEGDTATLYFARGVKSTDYKDVPTTFRVTGYQNWAVLEINGTNVVMRRQ